MHFRNWKKLKICIFRIIYGSRYGLSEEGEKRGKNWIDQQWGNQDRTGSFYNGETTQPLCFQPKRHRKEEAAKYVANSGLDHVTLAGHSKGGNMAAFCAYLLPEGMVDKVYSYDEQGLPKHS